MSDERPLNTKAPSTSMGRAVTHGVAWTGTVYLIETIAQLAITAVLARLLSPREYGIVAAANVFIQLASLISNVGINSTIMQMQDLSARRQRVAYSIVLVSCTLCFITMQIIAPATEIWFQMKGLANVVRVLGFIYVAQALGALSQSLLYRDLQSSSVYIIRLSTIIFANLAVAIPMAWLGYGYWALVGGTLAQSFANSIWLRFKIKTPLIPAFSWNEARALIRTAGGFSLAEIIGFAAQQGDNIIVGRFIGPAALGIYSRSYNLMALPTSMYGAIADRVVFPAMARVQNDLARSRSAYTQGVAITAFVGIPLTVLLVIVAPELIRVIFGHKWIAAIAPFEILSLAMYLRLSWRVSSSLLKSKGYLRRVIFTNAVQALLVIGGCLVTYRFGLNVLAGAVGVSFLGGFALVSGFACQSVGMSARQFARAQGPGVALGLLVAALAFVTSFAMRNANAPDYSVVLAVLAITGSAALAAIVFLPSIFVGPNVSPFLGEVLRLVRRPKPATPG